MSTEQNLIIHPAPVEEQQATDYALTVNGQPVFTHRARVSAHPLNQVWPGYQRPLTQTEIASFAAWDMASPVEVRIVCACPVHEVRVRPKSYGIEPEVNGQTIRFTVKKPGQLTVEVNGTHHALHLFANPIEEDLFCPSDPGVRYFGPGVHCPGLIRLESQQTLYLAGGAVVYGAVLAEKADNITLRGRGILDGSKINRMDATALVTLFECTNVRIDGITLRDSGGFTIAPIASRQVHIRNVKLIGNWRYNTDGIDFISCRQCSVEDSFIRSFDDSICIKGFENFGPFIYQLQLMDGKGDGTFTIDGVTRHTYAEWQQLLGKYACHAVPISDIQVRRCVLWNGWGRALEIGAETVASEISNLLFEDCDVIHTTHVAMEVQNCDRARCRDIVFRNIRVEFDDDLTFPVLQQRKDQVYDVAPDERNDPSLINLNIVSQGYASHDSVRGHIEDISFRDIVVTARGVPPSPLHGHDAEHQVQRVAIENLCINGQVVASLDAGGFIRNEFVRDVTIRGVPKENINEDKPSVTTLKVNRILFLGNSITRHPGLADSGWPGKDWGMAASAPDKDYVHLLLKRFTEAAGGKAPKAMVENIADFERQYGTYDVDSAFKKYVGFKPDVVILAIGENMPASPSDENKASFKAALTRLLALFRKKQPPAIFVRSSFFPVRARDDILRQVCEEVGGVFVDISHLSADESNSARSEHAFKHGGVAIHPGDKGMASIAEAIWNVVRCRL